MYRGSTRLWGIVLVLLQTQPDVGLHLHFFTKMRISNLPYFSHKWKLRFWCNHMTLGTGALSMCLWLNPVPSWLHWGSAGSRICLCRSDCRVWVIVKYCFGRVMIKVMATFDSSACLFVFCELKIKENKCWNRTVLTSTTRTVAAFLSWCMPCRAWSTSFLWLHGSPLVLSTTSSSACIWSCPFTMRSTIVEVCEGFSPSFCL